MSHDITQHAPHPKGVLYRILAWLSVLPVALIVVLTFADVLGRYLFSSPVRGSVELIEFAMALLIFTAMPLVTRQRGHVTVSLIDSLVKGLGRKVQQVLCDAFSALALGVLTWRLYLQGREDLASNSSTVVLSLPHAPLSFALTLFAGLTTLLVLVMIWRTVTAQGDGA
jgi:TRAP-type transport system small permease protein